MFGKRIWGGRVSGSERRNCGESRNVRADLPPRIILCHVFFFVASYVLFLACLGIKMRLPLAIAA